MHIRPRRDDELEHLVRVLQRTHDEDGYPAHWPDDPVAWLTPPGHRSAWTAWRLYERRGWRLTHRSPADWTKPDGTVPTMRWYEKRLP
ncbi:hypothetical protein M3666_05475 [Curtobacterium sp. ODYSSEY 48 V2]|uniref:hypothetical protein n=1 Tax=Curtobacterium sp. ODYSSEY 48 V2 TaxID=2939561 RepID=UPI00203C1217|nr:hypothetical protein [Curtobacterium sp. ODYSSEY 48 V2]MCM3504561.1 hypothetical protein [Curtobacterium sp. ODYSSEY 48 V2]